MRRKGAITSTVVTFARLKAPIAVLISGLALTASSLKKRRLRPSHSWR